MQCRNPTCSGDIREIPDPGLELLRAVRVVAAASATALSEAKEHSLDLVAMVHAKTREYLLHVIAGGVKPQRES